MINRATIDVNWIREVGEIELLKAFIADKRPGMMALTETHSYEEEPENSALSQMDVIAKSCAKQGGARPKGEVVIRARKGVPREDYA